LCNGSDQQKWARYNDTGNYTTSYLFTDFYNRCLAANPSQVLDGNWSYIIVADCNGSEIQKWNAPPIYTDSKVASYREIAG
jgi:hypothetical protein